MPIDNVYIGLPNRLRDKILWVRRQDRTNPLSHIEGGCDVVVEYHNGFAKGYDWIKRPGHYIRSFFSGIINYEANDFDDLDLEKQLSLSRDSIARLYARKYEDDSEFNSARFYEVWDSTTSAILPWEALEYFEKADPIDLALSQIPPEVLDPELRRSVSFCDWCGSTNVTYVNPPFELCENCSDQLHNR